MTCIEYTRTEFNGVSLTLYDAHPTGSVLEATTSGGQPLWQVRRGESPDSLLCNSGAPAPQCVVITSFEPHSSTVTSYLITGAALKPSPSITIDTFGRRVTDLNGDGFLDAMLEHDDGVTTYQTGHVYWQTYLFDGHAFVSSGCGNKHKAPLSAPTKPETGSCPR